MKSQHFFRWDPASIAVVSALIWSLTYNPAQAFRVDDSEEPPVEVPMEVDEPPLEEVAESATTETAAPDETQEVAGGTPASPGTYLFNARLEFTLGATPDVGTRFCSGTQIRPGWVVTAAHCIQPPRDPYTKTPVDIQVRIGATDFLASGQSGIVWAVSNIFVHPRYHRSDYGEADIALLQLVTTGPSQNTGETLRVGVPKNSQFYRSQHSPPRWLPGPAWQPGAGHYDYCTAPKLADGMILGWGRTSESPGDEDPFKLMTGGMAIWKDCGAPTGWFWENWDLDLEDRIVASGYASVCPGDSGGSLIAFDDDGQPFLVGVTSGSREGQCKPNKRFGVFTDVTLGKFQDWIERTINPPPPYNGGGSGSGELPGGSGGGPGTPPRQEQ